MLSSLLLGLLASAHAAIPVFVPPFEAKDHDAEDLASRMPAILAAELAADPDMQVVDPATFPDVGDTSAVMYMQTCPPGQLEGCAYVVGEAGDAAYAIIGTVRTLPPEPPPEPPEGYDPEQLDLPEEPPIERLVALRILDVKFYNEVLAVELVHTEETEESFADAVLLMMQDAASGWVGGEVDIRTTVITIEDESVDVDQAATELADLSQELGEVDGQGEATSTSAPHREHRPQLTMEQLKQGYSPETWEELGISAKQYLTWWNSGWDYASWSKRFDGRRGQLLLRAHGGLGLGPTHALYYGRLSRWGSQLTLEEIYVTHELATGLSSHVGLSVGYGLMPTVEIEAGASREGGRYQVDVRTVYRNEGVDPVEAEIEVSEDPQGTPQIWLGGRWAPLPASNLRPVAGLGLAWWFGHTLGDDEVPTVDTPAFTAPVVTSLRLLGGAELRLLDGLDLFAQVPVHLLVAGQDPALYDDLRIEGPEYGMTDKREPGTPFPLAASLQLGIQARLGGRGAKDQGPRAFDEDLEELD